jgi:hypothetical protein
LITTSRSRSPRWPYPAPEHRFAGDSIPELQPGPHAEYAGSPGCCEVPAPILKGSPPLQRKSPSPVT